MPCQVQCPQEGWLSAVSGALCPKSDAACALLPQGLGPVQCQPHASVSSSVKLGSCTSFSDSEKLESLNV